MGDCLRRVMGVLRSTDAGWLRLAISGPMRTWGAWMVVVAVLGFPIVASGADPLLRFRTKTFSETTAAGDLTFVEYEHGGQAPHEHFALFRTIGSQATLIKACRGYLPTDLEKLTKVVVTSACRWRSKEH